MSLEGVLHIILPQSWVEKAMLIIDASGVSVWVMIGTGYIHNFNIIVEGLIKITTLIGLILAIYIKIRKIQAK